MHRWSAMLHTSMNIGRDFSKDMEIVRLSIARSFISLILHTGAGDKIVAANHRGGPENTSDQSLANAKIYGTINFFGRDYTIRLRPN